MKFRGGSTQSKRTFPPKLHADDVPTLLSVLTIQSARGIETVKQPFCVLVFAEYPDKEWVTNVGQTALLGDMIDAGILPDPDVDGWESWTGRTLAFTKQDNKNPETGVIVTKLYPLPAAQQDEMREVILAAVAAGATKKKK